MRYATAMLRRRSEDELYRTYVAETLRLRGEGKYLAARYSDMLRPADDYDAAEVVEMVIERAGLEVIDG